MKHTNEISKEEFYRVRAESYPLIDYEALLRYEIALPWINLNKDTAVREIGCKFAILRDYLTESSHKVDYAAVDIDLATLKQISGYTENQFICHNVNKGLPFADSSADYIFCLEVLEHLENATFFFSEAKRILKPGGKIILSVPNPHCWMELWWNIRKQPDGEGHISSFTYQNIDGLTKFSGLELLDIQGTYTRIPFTARLFKKYKIMRTSNIFLTRSYLYLIQKSL